MFLAIKKYPILFLFALCTALFLSFLGNWQYERGIQKELEDQANQDNFNKQIINLNEIDTSSGFENGQQVLATGTFDSEKIIFHDNRLNLGKPGYHVFSVFKMNNGQSFLVNRGWVAMNHDRSILPIIKTDTEEQTIKGIIRYPVKDVYTLEEAQTQKQFPQRLQTIEVKDLIVSTAYPLSEFSVLLDADIKGEHYDRQWDNLLPGKFMSADKHYAYSLQWYSLAILGFIVFMVLIYKMANNEQR